MCVGISNELWKQYQARVAADLAAEKVRAREQQALENIKHRERVSVNGVIADALVAPPIVKIGHRERVSVNSVPVREPVLS